MAPLADAPAADPRWSAGGSPPPGVPRPPAPARTGWGRTPARLPPGFRWIAVRPGAAPPLRSRRRALGPTPRYAVIPRWGLADRVEESPAKPVKALDRPGPSEGTVRTTLFVTLLVFAVVTLVYVVRYVLLVINRNTLLNTWVAVGADWLGVVASVVAIGAVLACGAILILWLIARRAAVFAHRGLPEPRSVRALWLGSAVPLVHLFWAPVYVIELATIEEHYRRLRRPIVVWWLAWVFSYLVSIFAIFSSWASDAQGIATNTVLMVFAYLFGAATVAATARVFEGFVRKPVERPTRRWVVADRDGPRRAATPTSTASVELEGQEPAA
jgi:Domain of unknown function (DUF4328)